jgi:hypothetical protein
MHNLVCGFLLGTLEVKLSLDIDPHYYFIKPTSQKKRQEVFNHANLAWVN